MRPTNRQSRLFASFVSLGAVMVVVRFKILGSPPLRPFLPIVMYQDVLVCAALAWLFYALLSMPRLGTASRKLIVAAGWTVAFSLAVYTAISGIIYTNLHSPLTYQLWLASDHLRANSASLQQALSQRTAMLVGGMTFLFIGLSEGLWRFTPHYIKWTAARFFSPMIASLLLAYILSAHLWTLRYVARYMPAVANSELAFALSTFDSGVPTIRDTIPDSFFSDFVSTRSPKLIETATRPSVRASFQIGPSSQRPHNVVMIIMESVGARRLQLYNAPYVDTPEMLKLAQHGIVFNKVYAAQPYTSAAMSALFCSLYPQHGWIPTTRSSPNIGVLGVADVLAQHGYQTAFVHWGELDFDHEGDFLRDHGFQEVLGKHDDESFPTDQAAFSQAAGWIQAHSKRPFFLALWTQDTHHPYLVRTSHAYGVGDPNLNRYLNAVRSTDELIGSLARALDKMHLSDDTLLVITGDHGEAFGEHGQIAHNWTVFDEETRIPLLLVNAKVFPIGVRTDDLVQQIDIGPTLLAFLGYDAPAAWQGASVLNAKGTERAYLFCRYGHFVLGLVDGNFKYIYDFNRGNAELYDLTTDPQESHDLSADPRYSAMMNRDHLRLEAWSVFQNSYLHNFQVFPASDPRIPVHGRLRARGLEETRDGQLPKVADNPEIKSAKTTQF